VSESTIVEAIGDGCRSIQALADQTKAGTGCGSCRGLLAQLIERHAGPGDEIEHAPRNGSHHVGASANGS
jgi:nitrite reductase (NADH) large subunit